MQFVLMTLENGIENKSGERSLSQGGHELMCT